MKAVLGFLFILVGITVGWLVLSGQLPNPNLQGPTGVGTASNPSTKESVPTTKTTPLGTLPKGTGLLDSKTARSILGV